jgi:dTDP-4-amino-4,6-dideoxygalactose transaminase
MIPFSPPFIDDDVVNEVTDTLRSGWITTGPKVKALEDFVKKQYAIPEVLGVNSATSGMFVSLKWFGIGAGDEVIIPAYTYAATALVVHHAGAKPVMVDINDDFTIDIEAVRKAITPNTKAIIPVDFAGWPCQYDALMELVNSAEVGAVFQADNELQKKLARPLVLSDAAHSLGAVYKGRAVGVQADISVFSLHAVKNITSAEGGLIALNMPPAFNNSELYAHFRLMVLNGQTKDAFLKTKAGAWRYDIAFPGYKCNLPDVAAAIALAQIRKYETSLLPERKRVAERYRNQLSVYDWALLPKLEEENTTSSYHVFPLQIPGISEEQRDALIVFITEQEVSVNVHFIPLPMLTAFKEMGYDVCDTPNAYKNYSREVSLPIYPQLTDDQVDIVVAAVVHAYNSLKIR